MTKYKPYRNHLGRFSRIPLGLSAFFSKLDKDGQPNCYSGRWIVVGSGKRGIIQCIKHTECPTMLHTRLFVKIDWHLTDEKQMDAGERVRLASAIRHNLRGDVHDEIGKNAAHLLEESVKVRF